MSDPLHVTDVKTFITSGGSRNWLFVRVETDAGIEGVGEATLEGNETVVEAAINSLAERLLGIDPLASEMAWQRLYRHSFWRGGVILQSALSALDQALWDIRGKALDLPVYRLLGGPTRERVRLYVHAGVYDPSRLLEESQHALENGFSAIKTGAWISESSTPEREWLGMVDERLSELRRLVGDDVDLMFDNHGRSRPDEAIRLLLTIHRHKVHWFEEPTAPEAPELIAPVSAQARRLGISIATGERLFSRWEFRGLFENQLVDIVQPDLCHVGGITEAWKVAVLADTYRIAVAPHNPQGPVSTAASAHLALAIPNFEILEYVPATDHRERILLSPWTIEDGHLIVPERPGLGVDIDFDELVNLPAGPIEVPAEAWRGDGGVADV